MQQGRSILGMLDNSSVTNCLIVSPSAVKKRVNLLKSAAKSWKSDMLDGRNSLFDDRFNWLTKSYWLIDDLNAVLATATTAK
jgi:hypothetical protein